MKDEYSKYKMNLQISLGTNSLELVQVLLILLIFLKEKTLKAEFNVHCWDSMDTCFLGIYHYFFFFYKNYSYVIITFSLNTSFSISIKHSFALKESCCL